MYRFTLLLLSLSFLACSKYQSKLSFNPSEPLRVAVLPFYQIDDKGNIIMPDPGLLIDDASFLSSRLKTTPADYVQKIVQSSLAKSGLDIVSPTFVTAQLSHNGFTKGDGELELDYEKISSNDAAALCKLLACDALLYGKIKKWDRSYYAIQSVSSIIIELSLISAFDGKPLYHIEAYDSASRGITKGPTGISDLVLEPIKGLDNGILTDLAHNMVEKMLNPLYIENRPEFIQSSPPAIYASAHDAKITESGSAEITTNDHLSVLVRGSSGNSGFFSIGDKIQYLPMIEQDNGHYLGRYYPLPNDEFKNQLITVYLVDKYGKTSSQTIGTARISIKGKS